METKCAKECVEAKKKPRSQIIQTDDIFNNYMIYLTKRQIALVEPVTPALLQVAKEHESFSHPPIEDGIKRVWFTTQANRFGRLADQ
eukprot:7820914-Pyramimonas_sp.AAC.1